MILKSFQELIELAKAKGVRRIVVPNADDALVIGGLKLAVDEGLVHPILVGDREAIAPIVEEEGLGLDRCEIVSVSGDERTRTLAAIAMIREGRADILMKGKQSTGSLLKSVLDKEQGLRGRGGLTHMAVVQIPGYPKLVGFTDGGIILHPDLEQKRMIVACAADFFRSLGYEEPKIGLLAYYEGVNPKDPETSDWATIAAEAKTGTYGKARIAGPLAFDLCMSPKYCEIKGFKDDQGVAGDVDVVVAPYITACNATTKGLYLFAGATACGVVIGANAPIVMLSRADPPYSRLCSMALGIVSSSNQPMGVTP